MRKLLLPAIIGLIAILPAAAQAADRLSIADIPELPQAGQTIGDEALVVGAGVAVGAAAGYLLPFRAATLLGGMAGGLVSDWWYHQEMDTYQPLPRRNEH